jgi:hypothetical protein
MKKDDYNDMSFTDKAWHDMLTKLDEALPIEKKKRRIIPIWWLGIVASLVLGSVVGVSYLTYGNNSLISKPSLKAQLKNDLEDMSLAINSPLDQETASPKIIDQSRKESNTNNRDRKEKTITSLNTTNNKSKPNYSKINIPQKRENENKISDLKQNTPSTLPTPYEIPFKEIKTQLNSQLDITSELTTKDKEKSANLMSDKLYENQLVTSNELQRQLLKPLPIINQSSSIEISRITLNTTFLKPMTSIYTQQSTSRLSLSLQTGYLVISHKSLSDIGYLNLILDKRITEKYGAFATIGIGKETTLFEYFKVDQTFLGISTANTYSQIEERILGFGSLQTGLSHSISNKWNHRIGVGLKVNYAKTSPLQTSTTTSKATQPSETSTLRNQFYGQYDLGYTINSDFSLVGSLNMMTSPLSMKNNLVSKSINTYIGIGLRYQF